jgi:ankyrin repeat protein
MGKSTYVKMLRKTLQTTLNDHWIVKLDLNTCHNEFYNIKKDPTRLQSIQDAFELIKLKMEPENETRRKVLGSKLVEKRAFLIFDAFDEVCPYYREVAKSFLKCIFQAGISMIATTRPQEEDEIMLALGGTRVCNVYRLNCLAESEQIEYLAKYWYHTFRAKLAKKGKFVTEDDEKVTLEELAIEAKEVLRLLRRSFSVFTNREELWGIPLQIRMVAGAFSDSTVKQEYTKNSDLFKIFIEQRITSALKEKYKYDLTQAKQREYLDKKEHEIRILLYKLSAANLFTEGKCRWNVSEDEVSLCNTLGLATITPTVSGHEVIFIHKTFAEYLVAECFVAKIYRAPEVENLQLPNIKFADIILSIDFFLVRRFFDLIIGTSQHSKNKPEHFQGTAKLANRSDEILIKLITEDLFHIYKMLVALQIKFEVNFTKSNMQGFWKGSTLQPGDPPLLMALRFSSKEFVEELIRNGANIRLLNHKNPKLGALHMAAAKGLNELIIKNFDIMREAINTPDMNGKTPLQLATESRNYELMKFFIDNDSKCNVYDVNRNTPLHCAIKNDDLQAVKLLAASKNIILNQVDSKYWAPLHTAIRMSRKEIVSLLVDLPGIDLELKCKGFTALHCAVENGLDDTTELLLDKNADAKALTIAGQSCLHLATQTKLFPKFLSIFKNILDVNLKDLTGISPLHAAANHGNLEAVKILLDNGADANAQCECLTTPLHKAVANYHFEVSQLLVDLESTNIDVADDEGNTPLHLASEKGNADVMGLLIAKGADLNAMNLDRATPIQLAQKRGHHDVIKYLLKLRNIRNKVSLSLIYNDTN